MARPAKTGLEYFPLDVDMEQDDKIFFVEAKHGLIGFAIVVRLFMLIYKEGYFRRYDEEREAFMLAKRFSLDVDVIKNVVNDCINEGLFDKNLYSKHGILTSRGIQKRFLEACRRRKEATIIQEYFLLDSKDYDNIVFETLNPVNDDNNPGKCNSTYTENPQSKVKESKVNIKESKKDIYTPILQHWNTQEIIQHRKLTEKTRRSIRATLRSYSVEEVNKAISNYAQILQDPVYYWTHKWTLQEFLQRGIDKFLDWEIASSNFRGTPKSKPPQELPRGDPKEYAHEHKTADLRKAIEHKTVRFEDEG